MTAPRVGRPVRGSRTGRPIMVALDLLGRRAALRVLWELREAGLVDHEGGYRLTAEGRALLQALQPLSAWAERWGGAQKVVSRATKARRSA